MDHNPIWQTKLLARVHDPAEKALVLLRDPAGHEGGTSEVLKRLLGFQRLRADSIDPDNAEVLSAVLFAKGAPRAMYETVRRADWWAAAADRPQWPLQEIEVNTRSGQARTLKVADWAQVRWTKRPILIHPLTGAEFDIGQLGNTDLEDLKSRSFEHFAGLVARSADDSIDWAKTLLAFWRFGPELREDDDHGKLGALWPLLPADTRVPDHGIWDHLDLTSAFAGAFAADPDGEAALLALSIGPVQGFIEAARSTSDLWAGSHLLSRLAWEAMKPVCEELGPDAILFPKLRGVPQVDLWLRDGCGLDSALFRDCSWAAGRTDANPLFSAALPNRFVAIVPRSRARAIALDAERSVRAWLEAKGREVVDRLLEEAGLAGPGDQHCHRQMREQVEGFPQVHWAAVPFSLIRPRNEERQTDLDTAALSQAMAPFFGANGSEACGFLATPAWQVLTRDLRCDGAVFFDPNPGALYSAVYDLTERVHAAAKATRSFAQTEQRGWRCSLTGETEWLATDAGQLALPPGQREDTLWIRVARERPAWARKGEHLGALPAIKRLWPTLFAEEVARALGQPQVHRFVVSTHTMALAHQIEQSIASDLGGDAELRSLLEQHRPQRAALPPRLARAAAAWPLAEHASSLPALLDLADEPDKLDDAERARIEAAVRRELGVKRLETYYGLLLMDGDRMGKWLAGGDEHAISYRASFHPQVRQGFDSRAGSSTTLRGYANQRRALSPNRHLAISGALNDFSLHVVRHVVEAEHLGRVIYAGGDDVMAMLPVADLLPAMQRLRLAYSGHDPEQPDGHRNGFAMRQGFVRLNGRLMRMMGKRATASCGAVVAHHQAPLGAVLRELRAAEKRAKNEGGRDAFSITVIKRSGGALLLSAKWGEPMAVLVAVIDALREPSMSRRAVYNSLDWVKDLPADADPVMLARLLAYQWERQCDKDACVRHGLPALCDRIAALAAAQPQRLDWLASFLGVAEFLARETRSGVRS